MSYLFLFLPATVRPLSTMRLPGCTRLSVPSEMKTVSRALLFIGRRKNIVAAGKTPKIPA
jgi:hypothetical protein